MLSGNQLKRWINGLAQGKSETLVVKPIQSLENPWFDGLNRGYNVTNHPWLGMVTICYHTTYKNGDDWWQRDRITITCIGAQDDLWNSMRVGFPELLSAQKRISSKAPVFAWKETVFSCKFTLTLTQWRLDDQNNLYRSPAFVNFAPSLSSAAAFDVWQACDSRILRNPVLHPRSEIMGSHLPPKHWMAFLNPYCWWWTNNELWILIPIVHG